jgi:UDP-glucose 4-epimerase
LPISEEDPLGAQNNPYGATKVAVETFVTTYNQLYGMDALIMRYFNPFGPNELHEPETHAVPNFIRSVIAKHPIPLYWKGELVRDYFYVEDLARAHTAVVPLSGHQIFNVGSETGSKTIDVLRTIMEIAGYEVPLEDLGERAGDVPANFASSKKLMAARGWRAQVGLREGLERTYAWYRERFG